MDSNNKTREHLLTGMDGNQGFHVHYGLFPGKMANSVTADWEMVLLGERFIANDSGLGTGSLFDCRSPEKLHVRKEST